MRPVILGDCVPLNAERERTSEIVRICVEFSRGFVFSLFCFYFPVLVFSVFLFRVAFHDLGGFSFNLII